MHCKSSRLLLSVWLTLTVLAFQPSSYGCDNPVYRYALENWAPQPCDLILLKQQELSPAEEACWDQAQTIHADKTQQWNVRFSVLTPQEWEQRQPQLANQLQKTNGNQLLLLSPEHRQNRKIIWSGPVDQPGFDTLRQSAARSELAKRLIAGQAVVWVVIETSDRQAVDLLQKQLSIFLTNYSATLAAADQQAAATTPAVNSNKSAYWPPRFSVLTLDEKNPTETLLLNQLRQIYAAEIREPLLFPVFGRGRVLGGIPLSAMSPQKLRSACDFLTGACSCEVKERNPGEDLCLSADWASIPKLAMPADTISLLELDTVATPVEVLTIPPGSSRSSQESAVKIAPQVIAPTVPKVHSIENQQPAQLSKPLAAALGMVLIIWVAAWHVVRKH